MGTPDRDRLLDRARAAHRAHRYAEAHRDLRAAHDSAALPDDDLRLLADASWWIGNVAQFLSLTEELHERYLREGRLDRAALHALDLAGTFFLRGEPAVGSGWLSRARKLLDGQPLTEAHGILLYAQVAGALDEQQLDAAWEGARELQALAQSLDSPTFLALGLMCEGLVAIHRGDLSGGFALLDEAMLPVLANAVLPEFAGNIYCTIIAICDDLADLVRARQWVAAIERWLEAFSDAVMFDGVCRAHRVHLLAEAGAWERAAAEAEQVLVELAELNQAAIAEAQYHLGEIHRLRGHEAEARAAYAACVSRGRDAQPGLALLEAASGDTELAWAMISSAVASAASPFALPPLLRAQIEIGVLAGHHAAARSAAERLRTSSMTYPSPGFLAWADEGLGLVLLAEGDPAAAIAPLQRAADRLHRMGARCGAARVEVLLARAHRAIGNEGEAETHEGVAAALMTELGLPRASIASPGGLTGREIEVLLQVAGGATNRAVAETLFVSEATVRRHLANIYRKLDVSSRTAASAWAHQHRLL